MYRLICGWFSGMGDEAATAARMLAREPVRAIIGTDCSENEMVVGRLPGREVETGKPLGDAPSG